MKDVEICQMKEDIFDIPSFKSSNSFILYSKGKITAALYVLKKDSFILLSPDPYPSESSCFVARGKVELTNGSETVILHENDSFKASNILTPLRVKSLDGISVIYSDASAEENFAIGEYDKSNELVEKLEEKDVYTMGHSRRVCYYAVEIAMKLNDPNVDSYSLCRAAILHDIGKVKIPDAILNKPGKYTEEEFAVMKKHPEYSYEIAKDFANEKICRMILEHHERLNGSGYPNHLKDKQIDPGSKVLMVADVFDALTSSRVYRTAFSVDKSLEIIDEETAKGYYDPRIISALKECLHEGTIKV